MSWALLALGVLNTLLLLVLSSAVGSLGKRLADASAAHSAPQHSHAQDGVRDLLAAYELAGFDREQAASLVQEAVKVQMRQQGGWSA